MKIKFLLLTLALLAGAADAQVIVGNYSVTYVHSSPSGGCSQNAPMRLVVPLGNLYACQNGAWGIIAGGAGSGVVSGQAAGVLSLGTSANVIGNQSHLDDGVTTPATITSTEAFAGTSANFTGNVAAGAVMPAVHPVADITSPVYGALGNGVHDDAPAIRAAKNAIIAAGGGTIFIPPGTYNLVTADTDVGSYVNIQASHVHVVCAPGAFFTSSSSLVTLFRLGQITSSMHPMQTKTGFQANVLPNAGSATITITTPSDTSNYAVGDPIYILGGPGAESNGDGEINWITAINAGTGVLTLRKPTSKPYTGNNSNVGAPGIVTVMDGAGEFWEDLSLEGCAANNIGADFAYIGQVIGAKVLNNRVVINPTATRGMMVNSFYPMADIEIAGNSYTGSQGSVIIQLADGWRDIYIHHNDFSEPYGFQILNISQGIINTVISHNTFYYTVPAAYGGIAAAVAFSNSYQIQLNDNIFVVSNLSATNPASAIATGQSNGSCIDCLVENNAIIMNGQGVGSAISNGGASAVITNNKIKMINIRFGILTSAQAGPSYAQSLIANNKITMTATPSSAVGIWASGNPADIPNQGQTLVRDNFVRADSGALGTALMFTAAGGGDMSGNYVLNVPTAFSLSSGSNVGSPRMANNTCVGVTTTTNCNVLNDLGTQNFTGNVTLNVLDTPVVATPIAKTTGGTLADSTQFCYQIQARNAAGYSSAPTEKCVTTAGTSGGTNSVVVSWSAVAGATTYAIYGRTTAAEAHMSPDLNLTNTTFTDTGSITPSGAIQATMAPPQITWGGDTNVYRGAAGVVKTDGTFNAVSGYQINGTTAATTVNGTPCSLGGSCTVASAATPAVPSWLLYLGDGSDGAVTCTTSIANGFEANMSSFTINAGQTCKVAPRGHTIRVTGACTINGTLDASAIGVATTSVAGAGGTGGGGGGGAAGGAAGTNTPYGSLTPSSGGTAGASSGGAGGNGGTNQSHAVLSWAASGITGDYAWGGGGGGPGANSGGAAGNGGEFVILACGSLTGTGTIRADGGYGQPSAANSTGAGGGGGGGVIITRSPTDTSTLTLITNGAPGGSNVVPQAQWYGGGNSGLTTTTTVSGGAISAIAVGGTLTNWLAAPNCVIVGGGGTAATCHFTTSGVSPTLTITGAVVDAGGSGYTASTFTTSGTGGRGGDGWSKRYTQ